MTGNLEVSVSQMAVVSLRGEIDIAGLEDIRSVIEPNLALGQTIVLDLSEVTFADSTLLRVLHEARHQAGDSGGAVLVRNPSEGIRKLLTLGDLGDLVQAEVDRQNDAD